MKTLQNGMIMVLMSLAIAGNSDVISPEQELCSNLKVGDECTIGGKIGACTQSKCGRLSYSGGVPPKTISVDCLVCSTSQQEVASLPASEQGCSSKNNSDVVGVSAFSIVLGLLMARLVRRKSRV